MLTGWVTAAVLLLLLALQTSNLQSFVRPSHQRTTLPRLSILIPARDEELNIRDCLLSLTQQDYAGQLEIIVLDDHSSDSTGSIVRQIMAIDSRVRLMSGETLPSGWLGKNWACSQLRGAASGELLLFCDADTRLRPSAASDTSGHLLDHELALLSLMPRQIMETSAERLTIPLLHFFYLTFFPRFMAARSADPRFAAANGQFMLFRAAAYDTTGGHATIRDSIVDDLSLSRLMRQQAMRADMLDGSELVTCRMYRSAGEVIEGFSKNLFQAVGGTIGSAAGIGLVMTALFVAPPLMLFATSEFSWLIATLAGYWLRLRVASKFEPNLSAALVHPISIAMAVILLFRSTIRTLRGARVDWKGRNWGRE